jgi:hypothetical protein
MPEYLSRLDLQNVAPKLGGTVPFGFDEVHRDGRSDDSIKLSERGRLLAFSTPSATSPEARSVQHQNI